MTDELHKTVQSPPREPLLVYDGACGFCRHWIARWRRIAGDRVSFATSQEVGSRFPEIPPEAFQASVQLILPNGQVFSGAEAVYQTLAYDSRKRWMLWCYETLPGMRGLTEWAYHWIARHRDSASRLTLFLWGKGSTPATFFLTRNLFLRCLGAIYFIAFLSLGSQIHGLIGSNGILPIQPYLERVGQQLGGERYLFFPTLFWFDASDLFLQWVCSAGVVCAFLLVLGIVPAPLLVVLWVCYLSLDVACRDFLSYQWDALLLEVGFLAIFLAPLSITLNRSSKNPPSAWVLWLFRLLLFRLMFSSGVVKLMSGDPTWRDLTALNFHYATQPLPTWIGWYAHQLPEVIQKLSVLGVFGIELLVPFLIFAPRRLRTMGSGIMIFFQLLIYLTGNYCFFNLLTIALCLLLLDDRMWFQKSQRDVSPAPLYGTRSSGGYTWAIGPFVAVMLLLNVIQVTGLFHRNLYHLKPVRFLYRTLSPFRIVNHYGLFAVMTTTRLEILVEGSKDGLQWKPYQFRYKPGDVTRKPHFVAPHQPRLDWQMWFAALSTYQQHPWFVSFCGKLLEGSPEVLQLLSENPFPEAPPRYLRAVVYEYTLTDRETRSQTGQWWSREKRGLYCPILSLRSAPSETPHS